MTFQLIRIAVVVLSILAGAGGFMTAVAGELTPVAPVSVRPQATAPGYVAMLYHRLTEKKPDFDAWARASDAYVKANDFDRDLVLREKSEEAARAYHLITFDDPIVIELPVTLSAYSRQRQGYLVENFKSDTFYSFHFLDQDYALVPLDLMDYQWLGMNDDQAARSVAQKIARDEGRARMYLWVTPVSADREKPMQIADKSYWLLSGKVKRLQIFDKTGDKLLWEGVSREEAAQNRQQVLDLYK